MVQKCIMGSSGGGGSTIQETTVTAGTNITWTPSTPSDLDIKNYVLSGTFTNSSQLDNGDVILTVSNPPSQDVTCMIYRSPNNDASRHCILKTNGQLILNDLYIAAGFTWVVTRGIQGSMEYTG